MLQVNILTRYEYPLFTQHIPKQYNNVPITFHENSREDIEWDCVVVFDGLRAKTNVRVALGGLLFVAGEPPDAMPYTSQFLDQFDETFCAHPSILKRKNNLAEQYFNNWHYGYDQTTKQFRYTFENIRDLAPPKKDKSMSVIMSNLAYMPNHLKRLRFLEALQNRFVDKVDVYGRGHRFIPYKEDALLAYRFHLCIENCAIPNLWTEKIADPLLAYTVPVYSGCTNISKYFPENSLIQIDIDDVPNSLAIVERLLNASEEKYQCMIPHVLDARRRLLGPYNLIHFLTEFVEARLHLKLTLRSCSIIRNESTLKFPLENVFLRGRRALYRKCFHFMNIRSPHQRRLLNDIHNNQEVL